MNFSTVVSIVTLLAAVALSPSAVMLYRKIEATTKNENIKMMAHWAGEGAVLAEHLGLTKGLDNSQKKQEAMDFVNSRLKKNKLFKKFSVEQISAEVENAVLNLRVKQNSNNEDVTVTPDAQAQVSAAPTPTYNPAGNTISNDAINSRQQALVTEYLTKGDN